MIYKNLSDVTKFVADEIATRRKDDISFSLCADKPVTSDFLSLVIEDCPPLLMCIKNINYQVQNLGLILEYRLNIAYTNVMPACVICVTDARYFKQAVLSSALFHRRELFVVFEEELSDGLLSMTKTFTKDPELLSCYLQSVRSEMKRIRGCAYCGLQMQLSYTCSYKEYRLRVAELNRAIIDIIHEAKQVGIEDWKKAHAVVSYCVNNWTYGSVSDNPGMEFTAYGAVVKRKAVCMGISLAICMIYKELGIPCRYIQGKRNGEGHAWNMVFIKGGWFYIDVTEAIGAGDPLYHWGMTSFDDERCVDDIQIDDLKCNCSPNFIRTCLGR